jgi:predicted helicase
MYVVWRCWRAISWCCFVSSAEILRLTVVQSVGRVMRKSQGKIRLYYSGCCSFNISAEKAWTSNDRFK